MSTDIAIIDDQADNGISATEKMERISNPALAVYSTLDTSDFEGRLDTIAALQDTVSLSDHLGEVIRLANFITQVVEINDTETKRKIEAIRTVLIDEDGTAYHAISDGVLNALQTIVGGLGHPSGWPHPIEVTAIEAKGRSGYRFMTLVPVRNKAEGKTK